MRYHAIATFVVRTLGLLMILAVVPILPMIVFGTLAMGWDWLVSGPAWGPEWWYGSMAQMLIVFVLLGVGLYLFLRGGWVVGRLTKGLPGACAYCGYKLSGIAAARCPECGGQVEQQSQGGSL